MSDTDFFKCSATEGVALITIDRPPLNVLGFSQYHELCREKKAGHAERAWGY